MIIATCQLSKSMCISSKILSKVSRDHVLLSKLYSHTKVPSSSNLIHEPILVSIEGNIGAGKSTIMNYLKSHFNQFNYVEEPLATWSSLKNDDGRNLLETYYADRSRWSYTFQMFALLTRYHNIEQAIRTGNGARNGPSISSSQSSKSVHTQQSPSSSSSAASPYSSVFISERCLDTDYNCFTKMLHHDKAVDSLEYQIYQQYFQHFKSLSTPLRGIIYLNTSPTICQERIKCRNRQGEDLISLDYLQSLDRYTKNWIDKEMSENKLPVLIIDGNQNYQTREMMMEKEHDNIQAFILQIISNSSNNGASISR